LSQAMFQFNLDQKGDLSLRLKESEEKVGVDEVMAISRYELLPWMLACSDACLFNQKVPTS